MGRAIGIDLGTSECCVYTLRGGEPALIPSRTGTPTTPSWVAFADDGHAIVGHAARRQAVTNPERSFFAVTRLLGRKYHSKATTWLRDLSPYAIVPASHGDAWLRVDGQDISPEEVTSHLLGHLKVLAEEHCDEPVDAAVITVPACFDEPQRRALVAAARIAGFSQQHLLGAPLAAALAAVRNKPDDTRMAVVDVGAGHFDVAILERRGDVLETLAAAGDAMLGGDDLDRGLVALLADGFFAEHEVDLRADPTALQRLFEVAHRARHELTQATRSSPFALPLIASKTGQPLDLNHPGLTSDELGVIAERELQRMTEPCAWVLEDAGYGTDDLTELLLVGGLARVPAVQEQIGRMFRRRPRALAHPDQLAAEGAALLAGDSDEVPEACDVTAHSLGIKVTGGRFSPAILRNQLLPCRETRRFTPVRKGQDHALCEIYQGDAELVNETRYLGRLVITGLSVQRQAEVTFALDRDGLLSVATVDADGLQRPVSLERSGGLTGAEVESARERRARPRRARDSFEARVAAATPTRVSKPRSAPPADRSSSRPVSASLRPPTPQRSSFPAPDTDTLELPSDSLVGTVVSGRYRVEEIIGEGGMGRVYRARHLVLDKAFALKVLHTELAAHADIADRFVREAKAASVVDDEHVVSISDFGRLDDGSGFFVMEHLEGPTLLELIREKRGLDVDLVVDIGIQLADALQVAHDKGIVHRDLKPENVTLIERRGYRYFCKILDFGIAKSATSDSKKRITLAGVQLGTPHYMAPEQIDGAEVDARSDLYALGAVLHEMATGKTVFEADTTAELLAKHKDAAPTAIRTYELAAGFPEQLESLILDCLKKNPADRPQSANEVRQRLAALKKPD